MHLIANEMRNALLVTTDSQLLSWKRRRRTTIENCKVIQIMLEMKKMRALKRKSAYMERKKTLGWKGKRPKTER